MPKTKEMIDRIHEITDALEHEAAIRRAKEEAATKAYYEGYIDACEAFGKRMRAEIQNQDSNNPFT